MPKSTNKKVVKAVRDAVVAAAAEAEILKQKSMVLTKNIEKKWRDSKPDRQKAVDDLKNASQQVVNFGKDVAQGMKEGMEQVRNGSRK